METRCEHCGQECWVDAQSASEEVLCPCCDRAFTARELHEHFQPLTALVESLLAELPPVGTSVKLATNQPAADAGPPPRRRKSKRRMPKSVVRALLVGIAIVTVASVAIAARSLLSSIATEQDTTDSGNAELEWQPDPALSQQLGDTRGVDHFSFRLPGGFKTLTVLPDPAWMPHYGGHFTGLMWRGPLGDKAELYCTIVTFPSETPLSGGLEDALERFFEWLNHHAAFTRFSHSEGEVGRLNGRYCIRASFSGRYRMRNPSRVEEREGVVYVMLDQNRQISLYTLCSPDARETHDVMGASLLTWKEN